MFKFYLIILIATGSGYKVDTSDGWGLREQPNWKVCIQRKNTFNENSNSYRIAICRKRMG